MKLFSWSDDKNKQLIQERGLSFERVIYHIEREGLLDVVQHPNKDKYPQQKMFIVCIDKYVFLIPFVESETEIFLKTIIPSRKATKKYIGVSR